MKSFRTLIVDGKEYWYRVTGNRHGWTLSAQLPSTPSNPYPPVIKLPFWEQPINKREREAEYKKLAKQAIAYLSQYKLNKDQDND